MDIRIGGAILRLPDEAGEDAVQAAIADYRASPDFDSSVDKARGAPASVRELVGGSPYQDRLANLKRYYPDAIPYGDDNFVFTDPETQRPTLYNPKGLDFGDVASVAREGTQVAFSGLGAAAGAIATAPSGPGAVGGGAVGAGIGNVVGARLYDFFANLTRGRVDTRTAGQVFLESGGEFGSAAAGQRVGELAPEAFKGALRATKPGVQRLVAAYGRLRVPPPAAAVTRSSVLGTIEKTLESSPTAAGIMQRNAETVLNAVSSSADDIARRFGTVQSRYEAGGLVKKAAVRAAERFGFAKAEAYENAFDLVGADTRITVPAVRRLYERIAVEQARAPNALRHLREPLRRLNAILLDAGDDGAIRFDALRSIRTAIGQELDDPILVGGASVKKAALKRIYGALSEDMAAGAGSANGAAARALAGADRYTRLFTNTAGETLNKIQTIDADEKAFDWLVGQSKHGARNLARMRRAFSPQEWDDIAATALHEMGRATPGAQDATGASFSVSRFLTNWSRATPEAKQALFGGERYRDLAQGLDDLVEVSASLKAVEKFANTSNTGRTMISHMSLTALGGALLGGGGAAAAGQDPTTGAVAGLLAPWAAAKLITNPSFVRWLTTPVTKASAIGPHMARLIGIAEAEPELTEAVYQYLAAMRAAPVPAGP